MNRKVKRNWIGKEVVDGRVCKVKVAERMANYEKMTTSRIQNRIVEAFKNVT